MIIEKTVVENHIPLKETFTNRTGDLVLVCESTEKRDELKALVQNGSSSAAFMLSTPREFLYCFMKVIRESFALKGTTEGISSTVLPCATGGKWEAG